MTILTLTCRVPSRLFINRRVLTRHIRQGNLGPGRAAGSHVLAEVSCITLSDQKIQTTTTVESSQVEFEPYFDRQSIFIRLARTSQLLKSNTQVIVNIYVFEHHGAGCQNTQLVRLKFLPLLLLPVRRVFQNYREPWNMFSRIVLKVLIVAWERTYLNILLCSAPRDRCPTRSSSRTMRRLY